jgi:hypothetical protein
MIGTMLPSPLAYLDFEASEDEQGHCSFDAMAAVGVAQVPLLQAEIARVLDWAHANFGAPAPLDEAGVWDHELQGVRELVTPVHVSHSAGAGVVLQDAAQAQERVTLSLTLTGTTAFCDAFRQAFGVE